MHPGCRISNSAPRSTDRAVPAMLYRPCCGRTHFFLTSAAVNVIYLLLFTSTVISPFLVMGYRGCVRACGLWFLSGERRATPIGYRARRWAAPAGIAAVGKGGCWHYGVVGEGSSWGFRPTESVKLRGLTRAAAGNHDGRRRSCHGPLVDSARGQRFGKIPQRWAAVGICTAPTGATSWTYTSRYVALCSSCVVAWVWIGS